MNKIAINRILRYIVIAGNAVYFLWILYNGINEGFSGGLVIIVSSSGLLVLLVLNIFLLYKK